MTEIFSPLSWVQPGSSQPLCYLQWKTISRSAACCGGGKTLDQTDSTSRSSSQSVHQPLYPPGRIIHIVRHHPATPSHTPRDGEVAYQGDVSLSQSLSQRQELIVCRGLGRQQGLRLCADLWSDAAGPHAGQCPGCSLSGDNTLHFTSLPQCWIFLEFNQQRTNHHHLSPASLTSPVTTSYFLTNKLY